MQPTHSTEMHLYSSPNNTCHHLRTITLVCLNHTYLFSEGCHLLENCCICAVIQSEKPKPHTRPPFSILPQHIPLKQGNDLAMVLILSYCQILLNLPKPGELRE